MQSSSSHVNWKPGYDISFPIFSNASNAGLPSLAKNKIMAKGKPERETVNKQSKQYFILKLDLLTSQSYQNLRWSEITLFTLL